MDEQLRDREQVKEWMDGELNTLISTDSRNLNYEVLYEKIRGKIHVESRIDSHQKIVPLKKLLQVAAVLIIVFLFGGLASFLVFRQALKKEQIKQQYCEVVAPYGARSEVVLPDSSKVWLNAGSKLRYSTDFNVTNRNLSLTGEGFFDVSKNKELPFVVNALDLKITALGTQFNVKAYKDDEVIETTLIEGKVKLESEANAYKFSENIYLLPNQKAVLVKKRSKVEVEDIPDNESDSRKEFEMAASAKLIIQEKIDPIPDIAWKNNKLVFNAKKLSEILIELERKFNVKFQCKSDKIQNYKFTGTLDDETLQQVLDAIKLSAPFDYSIDGNVVTLMVNSERMNEYEKQLQ
ncbi:FecR family protein [Maribellus comscasis]|uniref:FecR family protein n=1 Tax=Maribellus comscasis TaxID=2681766 RepID=UPI00131B8FE9|nr:FecR family protein [Maribellus comscasis]